MGQQKGNHTPHLGPMDGLELVWRRGWSQASVLSNHALLFVRLCRTRQLWLNQPGLCAMRGGLSLTIVELNTAWFRDAICESGPEVELLAEFPLSTSFQNAKKAGGPSRRLKSGLSRYCLLLELQIHLGTMWQSAFENLRSFILRHILIVLYLQQFI